MVTHGLHQTNNRKTMNKSQAYFSLGPKRSIRRAVRRASFPVVWHTLPNSRYNHQNLQPV
ncbi:protein of unknown function [Enterobacter cancerogenus]|nr:protein of unknown function [Enterobacter cancerogenus]